MSKAAAASRKEDRERSWAGLAVAGLWILVTAAVHMFVTAALAPQLPDSVVLVIPSAAPFTGPSQFATPDFLVTVWWVIGISALVVLVGVGAQLLGAKWSIIVPFVVATTLPFLAASSLVSLIYQVGLKAPITHLPGLGDLAALVVGGIVLILGILSVGGIGRWLLKVVAAFSVVMLLASCVGGVPNGATKETLRVAVIAEVPHATDAIVGLNYDGSPTRPGVAIKVYLDRATPEDVLVAVEKLYFIGWTKFPVEPSSVTVAVVDGQMQLGDTFANPMGLDLSEAASSLKAGDIELNALTARPETLERLFGPWKDAAGSSNPR